MTSISWFEASRNIVVIVLSLAWVAFVRTLDEMTVHSFYPWLGAVIALAPPSVIAAIGCTLGFSFRRYLSLGALSSVILGASLLLPPRVDEEIFARPVVAAVGTAIFVCTVALTAAAGWALQRAARRRRTIADPS